LSRILLLAGVAALVVGAPLAGARVRSSAAAGLSSAVSPGGTGWEADASALQGLDNQRFAFICPSYGSAGSVYGTDVYTDVSSVCAAAVLEGRITLAGGGLVTVEIQPGRTSYRGSTSNGITSNSYGSYPGSYVIVGATRTVPAVGPGGSGWNAAPSAYADLFGARFLYGCPAQGTQGSVYGTGVYTNGSSVCTAAVLEGRITLASGGSVTIEIRPGEAAYKASTANGITSNSYGSYPGSYVIVSATRTVPAVDPGGTGSNMTASALPGSTGDRFVYTCPAYGSPGTVWGTAVYTDDSSACSAAVLEGRITLAGGGTVTVELRPGQGSYKGSTSNGVSSNSYGRWGRSFALVAVSSATAAVGEGGTGWAATASAYIAFLGARFLFACPGKGTPGLVWGTGVYTSDSSICTAAVLAGLITVAGGATVTVELRPGQSSYKGSTGHGITSMSYGRWAGSYVLAAAGSVGSAGNTGSTGTASSGASPPNLSSPPSAPPGPLSPPLPRPVAGSSVDVKTFRGTVLVNGKPLVAGEPIKVGATVNATKGTITMTSVSPGGTLQTANFASGLFKVQQKGPKGVTQLTLGGGNFALCKRKTAGAAATQKKTIVRGLWGSGKGQFTTNGRYAAATVRGTIWLTEDRCDGTLIFVKRGTVSVLDKVHHRTVTVTAGHSYLA
jgi:LCCL domain-containing protein